VDPPQLIRSALLHFAKVQRFLEPTATRIHRPERSQLRPKGDEGRSLAPFWRPRENPDLRASLYTAMGQTIRAVRDERFKYIATSDEAVMVAAHCLKLLNDLYS
jgi:hypothetical protein